MLINNHTYFSLRYGTFSEEELLQQAQNCGYKSIALTDINNTSVCLNFVRLAQQYGIKPIVGIDFRNGVEQQFVGIAKNNEGFLELNRFLSYHSHNKTTAERKAPHFEHAAVIYPLSQILKHPNVLLKPNEYVGIKWQDLAKIHFWGILRLKGKLVIQQPVTFRNKRDFNIHRLLRAIDNNTLLHKLNAHQQTNEDEIMLHKTKLLDKFKDYPFIVKNTEKLMEECSIHFDFSDKRTSQNKKDYSGNAPQDLELLKKLCNDGLSYRYTHITETIKLRVEKELNMIQQMNFVPFFLINWDIVSYAKHKGYYHVGRGSGANSIVAYLLGITDVDPIELDLYFERFMNLYRANPPDFDIDFSWRDREDVTRYIFERFGKQGQTALLATYNTFKHSGAVRELGKVFGLPNHEIDILSSGKYNYENLDKLSQLTHRYAQYMYGMPNHLSIHAGGILISEKPIHYFSATDLPPKGFATTQFDMVIAEDVGLYKYDILGQRGLGKIKDALHIVKQNKPDAPLVDIHNVKPFIEDKNINQMVSRADCIGCFYVESPAMRMLLKKLEVDTYLGLVAASSIIRPGVAKSGMMREYILRHKNPERRKQANPIMLDLMQDTYGVMVYQEDVIKVAHYVAGLDLGEADVLRRGMSGKFRSREEFQKVQNTFFVNCLKKGYNQQQTTELWKQIESFAGYAFAKGHSASYAIESYQSLYLKHYYPLEYMVATINNGGGFYRSEIYLHEARMKGGIIHPPHINKSSYETTIYGNDIYLGFHFLNGLESNLAYQIVNERRTNGLFQSLDDFINRISVGIEQLDILIRINAFRFTKKNKRNLLWQAHLKLNTKPKIKQNLLFADEQKNLTIPELSSNQLENTFDEIELLGFSLQTPFELLKEKIDNPLLAEDMKHCINKSITLFGYLVTVKNTRTSDGKTMNFGTFLDPSGQWIDTVHFPPIAKKFPFRGKGIYKLHGKVMEEFGFLTLEMEQMEKLPYMVDCRYSIEDGAITQ
ncbi:MAG: DNA polymerase III subunit alpha [Flavobacteriales bacterium]|nr:DNA polymerase III subunit alpha [Flavobacteriales bacterium]